MVLSSPPRAALAAAGLVGAAMLSTLVFPFVARGLLEGAGDAAHA